MTALPASSRSGPRGRARDSCTRPSAGTRHARRHRGMALSPPRPDQPAARQRPADSGSAVEAVTPTAAQLRKGDVVEVRSAAEILATLDERGELDALPFMPEMVAMCGRRFTGGGSHRTHLRHDHWRLGFALHAGHRRARRPRAATDRPMAVCRGLLVYWEESWLRRVGDADAGWNCAAVDDTARDALLALSCATEQWGDPESRSASDVRRPRPSRLPIRCCQGCSVICSGLHLGKRLGRSLRRVMARAVVMESAKRLRLCRTRRCAATAQSRLARRGSTWSPANGCASRVRTRSGQL